MNSITDSNEECAELQTLMGDYFDALLHDSSALSAQSIVAAAVTVPVVSIAIDQAVAEAAPLSVVPDAARNNDVPALPVSEAARTAHDGPAVAETQTVTPTVEQAPAVPSYQLIRIGGLTLGIATQSIAEISAAPPQWTPLGAVHPCVLGSYSSGSEMYTVVDIAALLVPGSTLQSATAGRCVVLLAGQRWALACDDAGERVTPDPAQVNWRGAQGKRPWLAGTLRTPTCALLDISEVIRLLEN